RRRGGVDGDERGAVVVERTRRAVVPGRLGEERGGTPVVLRLVRRISVDRRPSRRAAGEHHRHHHGGGRRGLRGGRTATLPSVTTAEERVEPEQQHRRQQEPLKPWREVVAR